MLYDCRLVVMVRNVVIVRMVWVENFWMVFLGVIMLFSVSNVNLFKNNKLSGVCCCSCSVVKIVIVIVSVIYLCSGFGNM